jgi:hypothetical protein
VREQLPPRGETALRLDEASELVTRGLGPTVAPIGVTRQGTSAHCGRRHESLDPWGRWRGGRPSHRDLNSRAPYRASCRDGWGDNPTSRDMTDDVTRESDHEVSRQQVPPQAATG